MLVVRVLYACDMCMAVRNGPPCRRTAMVELEGGGKVCGICSTEVQGPGLVGTGVVQPAEGAE